MSLQNTPHANRLHIGIFGKVNSGKSTLLNAITNQDVAITSAQAGTTTDVVYKAMELHGIGPVLFMDTAGFDDTTVLGNERLKKTNLAKEKSDIALLVVREDDIEEAITWANALKKQNTPCLFVVNQDNPQTVTTIVDMLQVANMEYCIVDAKVKINISEIKDWMIRNLPEGYEQVSLTSHLIQANDVVVLVMPQDIQAPKGRLILPQVQTIRDLLDHHCIVVSCTTNQLEATLDSLKQPPACIICDSQVFKFVFEHKPKTTKLTSFSILLAAYKGDVQTFVEGAKAIANLHKDAKILIAEACTHAPLSEDIGTVKIPNLLRKKISPTLQIDHVSGNDFPSELGSYDLIIHCGACMFNRKYVLSRIEKAKQLDIPISNYGVVLAYLNDILDKVEY